MTYRKIRDGKPFTSDNVLRHKDGRNVWVNTAFAPIFNDKAELVTIVSIGTDITRQKELEGLQRNLVGELEKRVSERTEQLNAINEELRSEIWEKQRLSDELYHQSIDLNDSLQYAKRIQESLLPQQEAIHRSFSDHFILFLPRNVVSGDLYWHHRTDDLSFFATIDCTGHGVPGALMSMIANELMNQAIIQRSMDDLSEILNFMNKLVVRTLRQKTGGAMRDGMDLSLIKIDHKTDSLWFAGAFNNAYLVHNGQLNTLNGSRFSIGGHLDDGHKSFQVHQIPLGKGDTIYLTTDGYIDQFGGPNGKKFMKKRFEELLLELNDGALCDQKETLLQTLHEWMGPQQQIDDILVVGLRY
jgi:serine phosphatase RsbU (regulator of sigma subunit)